MELTQALQTRSYAYLAKLQDRFANTIQNKWFWLAVLLILGLAYFAYAAYCTSRGYHFTGGVKLHWPKVWQMSIGCY